MSLDDLTAQAKHGDMVFDTASGDRSLGVGFVRGLGANGEPLERNKLVQHDASGSGYCNVPLVVTRHFFNPVACYLPALAIKTPDGPAVSADDWLARSQDRKIARTLGIAHVTAAFGVFSAAMLVIMFIIPYRELKGESVIGGW